MKVTPLASGSKGNSYLVRNGSCNILVDAGLSARQLSLRLQNADCNASEISAIFISHEHEDHIRGARVFAKQFDVPVFMNESCYRAARQKFQLDEIPDLYRFETGYHFDFQDFSIHPFSVSHDAADPVAFSISNGKSSLGIITDLGKVSTLVRSVAMKMDALILEANHDPLLLKGNRNYPEKLKQRIRSKLGHLSNEESAELVRDLILKGKLKKLVLAHLSEENNSERHIKACFSSFLSKVRADVPYYCAKQYSISPSFQI